MQISEFIEASTRLEKYYDKEYSTEQRQIMYEELRGMSVDRYKQLISALIRKNKFLPKIADFIETNREEACMATNETEKIDCKKCNSTGYLIYRKKVKDGSKELEYEYAYLCECKNAKQYKGWETEDKRYRSNYYIPTKQEIGF